MINTEKRDIKNIKVLIVEDDEGHVRLIEKNLRNAGLSGQVSVADTDINAISLLKKEELDHKNIEPLLIMLDLHIPGKGGLEVLRYILTHRAKIKTMVIVFSGSSDTTEIKNCYKLGCNMFISKPSEYEKFAETIQSLCHFLSYIKFP